MRISDWSSDVCSSDLKESTFPSLLQDLEQSRRTEDDEDAGADRCNIGVAATGDVEVPFWHLERMKRGIKRLIREIIVENVIRSEESRVGKEFVSTCRSWWSP